MYAIGGAEGAGITKAQKQYLTNRAQTMTRNLSQPSAPASTGGGAVAAPVAVGGGEDYGGGGGGGFDFAAYLAELQRMAQQRADEAYERNMERIANAYNSAASSLSGNYNSTVERLNAAKDKSSGDVNMDAEKSLHEAYINNMLTKKNLNQRLSAMGYNGGAAESTMAKLENNYGDSRLGINNTRNDNLSDLNMTYGDNLASALQSYNSAKANLDLQRMQMEIQAENARQNALDSAMSSAMSIDGSYYSALQSALKNQSAYTYNPSQATNAYVAANVQQAQNAASSTNYAKAVQQAMLEATNNTVSSQTLAQLSGYDANALAAIIAQLRARGYNVA